MGIRNEPRAMSMSSRLQRCHACSQRLPLVTVLVTAIAILLQVRPGLGNLLSFDRTAIAVGEYWRFFTGHLTHWNADHLIWDVFMFALLGAMLERSSRTWLIATLLTSATTISAVTWLGQPAVEQYRGLSGIDSALFTLALLNGIDETRRTKQPIAQWALIAMAMGFVGKILWELATGSTLFVDSAAAGFTPLPLVHAVGGASGVLIGLATKMPHEWFAGQLSTTAADLPCPSPAPTYRYRKCSLSALRTGGAEHGRF